MTQDEIIEMVRIAEDKVIANQNLDWKIEFAKLVAAKEREACAEICDLEAEEWKSPKYHYATAAAEHCAKAIRARGEA